MVRLFLWKREWSDNGWAALSLPGYEILVETVNDTAGHRHCSLEPSHLTALGSGFLLSAKYAAFTDYLGRVLQWLAGEVQQVFTISF